MNNTSFISALPLLAQALGNTYGVKVILSGDRAYTNGKTIVIPELPMEDPDLEPLLSGYLDHEAAHVLFTDFDLLNKTHMSDLMKYLQNCLEDVRIEKGMSARYPGCQYNLHKLMAILVQKGKFKEVDESHPGNLVAGYLLYSLRLRILDQIIFDDLAKDAANKLENRFPGLREELDATVQDAPFSSTSDVLQLTEMLIEVMKKYIESPPPPQAQQKEQKKDEDEQNQTDSPAQGQNDQTDKQENSEDQDSPAPENDNKSSQFEQSDKNPDDFDAQDNADSSDTSAQPTSDQLSEEEARKQQAASLEEAFDSSDKDLPQLVGDMIKDEFEKQVQKTPAKCRFGGVEPADNEITHVINKTEVLAQSNALRTQLLGLIQAKQSARHFPKRSGSRIDRHQLVRVASGFDQRAFQGRNERQKINTAIHVLLDRSSSMNESQMHIANNSMLAIKLALENVSGVSLGLSAFPAVNSNKGFVPLLRHGERNNSTKFGLSATGGTPLAQALLGVAGQMANLPEHRKIIIVLTDGEPNNSTNTKKAITKLTTIGFELVGVGIQSEAVNSFFKHSSVVSNIQDLPQALFSELRNLLI